MLNPALKGFFLFLFITIMGILAFSLMHEAVHVTIFKHFGVPSHVELYFVGLQTIAEQPCLLNCDSMNSLNLLNEIVGYHLVAVLFGIYLLAAVFYTVLARRPLLSSSG